MCGAEVAILRLNPSHTDEVLCSSADYEHTTHLELQQESSDKLSRFVADISGSEYRSSSGGGSEQIVLKLTNGFGSSIGGDSDGGSSHGEIRLISPKGSCNCSVV